jgi:hypothetical protein
MGAVKGVTMPPRGDGVRLFQPNARQAALLVLHLLGTGGVDRREVSRARLTEITIRRLWRRTRVSEGFLLEVQEFLLGAGWALFWAGSSYAIIRVAAVEGWPRISSKRIENDLERLSRGRFDFDEMEHLLLSVDDIADEEENAN